jgi:beta-phosphoglucomutase-like phosphatase (HAD superfamily)
MSINAVIFDFNGVLVDDESVHYSLFSELLAIEGVTLSHKDYLERYLGYDDRKCFETVLLDSQRSVDAAYIDWLIAQKARRYTQVASGGLRFFPAASEALGRVAARWPVAICSGALRAEIEHSLKLLNRLDQVAVIISAEDTTNCKPHPEGYQLALAGLRNLGENDDAANMSTEKRTDLTPANCLVIEDSLAGIVSAKSAGMWAIGVPNTYSAKQLLDAGADDVILGLGDLTPTFIDQRFAS